MNHLTTRRNFVGGIAGILAAQSAPGVMIGLRGSMMVKRGELTAKSYVQDGLIAMWDGIENAGWGTHSKDTNDFLELVSGDSCTVASWCGAYRETETPAYSVTNKGLRSNATDLDIGVAFPFIYSTKLGTSWNARCTLTIEFCRYIHSFSDPSPERRGIVTSGPATTSRGGDISTTANTRGLMVMYSGQWTAGYETEGLSRMSVASTPSDGRWTMINGSLVETTGVVYAQFSAEYLGFGTSGYDATLHCLRYYNRALSEEEMIHNQGIDAERFGLTT